MSVSRIYNRAAGLPTVRSSGRTATGRNNQKASSSSFAGLVGSQAAVRTAAAKAAKTATTAAATPKAAVYRSPFDPIVSTPAATPAPAGSVQAKQTAEPAPTPSVLQEQVTVQEGDQALADTIRSLAAQYGLPGVSILNVHTAYAGFTNPQTGSSTFVTGLVQLADGYTLHASEFFESPTNRVDARLKGYAARYSGTGNQEA